MANNTVHSCPSCNALNTSVLKESTLLVCKNCNGIVTEGMNGYKKPKPTRIPADWSFLQLHATGEYQQQPFTIVGRIRLQLRNDYKNFWCAALPGGNSIWLMESFASFTVLTSAWRVFNQGVSHLRAGGSVKLGENLELKGEYVEKCEGVSYEGEIGNWKLFYPAFFLIQASNKTNQTGVFTIEGAKNIEYLSGEKVEIEQLKLKNIILWDEWR